VSADDSPGAAFAVGVQAREVGTALAPARSPAMLYAEWARLTTGGEPGSGPVRGLDDDGFLVDVDEQVALRDVQVGDGGQVVDMRECRAGGNCPFMADRVTPGPECEPAPGCPTVDSESGTLRAVQVASLHHREPEQNLIYEIRTEREVTSITEPARAVHWDGESPYFLVQFPRITDEDNTLVLTIRYADGGSDRLTMRFRAEGAVPPGATTTTT
jgi:hypothetical protein